MLVADGTFLKFSKDQSTWIYASGYEIFVSSYDGSSRFVKEKKYTEYSHLGAAFYIGHLAQGLL